MKKKKSIKQILFARISERQKVVVKSIHAQLEETIAERKTILANWERTFISEASNSAKDVHTQLAKTIAQYKKDKQQWNEWLFAAERNNALLMVEKNAA